MYCHQCGEKTIANAAFCNACGQRLITEPNIVEADKKRISPADKTKYVATESAGGKRSHTIKIVLSLIFFVFLWVPFLSPIFTDAIGYSDYFLYGGEGKAFLAAVLQSVIWIAGMAPLLWFWNKKRTTSRDE